MKKYNDEDMDTAIHNLNAYLYILKSYVADKGIQNQEFAMVSLLMDIMLNEIDILMHSL